MVSYKFMDGVVWIKNAATLDRLSLAESVDRGSQLNHKERIYDFLIENKIKVKPENEYWLEAVSGDLIEFDNNYQALISKIETHQIDCVISMHPDRLSRDPETSAHFHKLCRKHGVVLIFIDNPRINVHSSIIGDEWYHNTSIQAYSEKRAAIRRANSNLRNRLSEKWSVGGVAKYGFKYVDAKVPGRKYPVYFSDIDEKESEVVRLVFKLFIEYKKIRRVANILNERGYRTRNSGKKKSNLFSGTTIRGILTDTRYMGKWVRNRYQGCYRPDKLRLGIKGSFHINKDTEKHITVDIKPIVSVEEFELANQILSQIKYEKPASKVSFLFSGMYCSCGGRFYGHRREKKRQAK